MEKFIKWLYGNKRKPFIFLFILSLLTGMFNFLVSFIPGLLTNQVNADTKKVTGMIVILLICLILNFQIKPYISKVTFSNFLIFKEDKIRHLYNKVKDFSLRNIENKDIQEKIYRSETFFNDLIENIASLFSSFSNLSTVFLMLIITLILNPKIFFLILLFTILSMILKSIEIKNSKGIWDNYGKLSREEATIHRILIDKEHSDERKVFNSFYFLNKIFTKKYSEFSVNVNTIGLKRFKYEFLFEFFSYLSQVLIFIYLVYLFYLNEINIGYLIIVFSFVRSIYSIITTELFKLSMFQKFFVNFNSYLYLIENYYSLIEKDKITKEELSRNLKIVEELKVQEIKLEFKNVYFKYESSTDYAIKDFSYTFRGLENYVIVGPNGCGKSTLTKLLVGLYRPHRGSILLNGIDVYSFSDEIRQKVFSYLFQNPNKYPLTIKENISFQKDINSKDILDELKIVEESMEESIINFKNGIDTSLSLNEDEVISLSGGQMQKVFFTRMNIKESLIFIFDEPTAALDPIAELKFYESIHKLMKDTLNIFISHRMGIIKYANNILVMADGHLIEHGDFKSLINKGGKFHEMYTSQKSLYEE